MAVEVQPPEVLAFVIADHVHRDESTGKFFVLGTRASIGAAAFPFTCANLAVYVSMIAGRGETSIQLRLIDVDETREPVLDFETTANFLDPTEELEMAFRLVDLVFPEPGDYRWQLCGAGQLLRERRFLVIPLENPGNPSCRMCWRARYETDRQKEGHRPSHPSRLFGAPEEIRQRQTRAPSGTSIQAVMRSQ